MKIQKIYTKLIKPNTPTPQNLKTYKISFLDKCLSPMNLAVLLFYQSKQEDGDVKLEESLARILVQFYPLAGRYIKDDQLVDCSDQGAEFVKAEALDTELVDLVGKNDAEKLSHLFPDQYFRADEEASDPLMSVQATHFPCGGLVIAISVSHRVFDIPSIATLISAWSGATNPDGGLVGVAPTFHLPSLLPCGDHNFGVNVKGSSDGVNRVVARRLSFDRAALTSLRSKIWPDGSGETVPGARLVSAVVARALISLDREKHGRARDFVIFQIINMRERMVPPQSKHVCGNLSFTSLAQRAGVAPNDDMDIGVQELVDVIGDGVDKTVAELSGILRPDEDGLSIIMNSLGGFVKALRNPETNFLAITEWTELRFYEADFGWGKPVWASMVPQRMRSNAAVLMGNKEGDGIDAWVYLDRDEMPSFEQDEEIKLFAF